MENKETASTFYFGVDLCKQAENHVEFLGAVDAIKELKDPEVLRRAVFRYEKFWLPLASEHPDQCMSAPIDIEWVWHCHLLSPVCYEKDCKSVVGTTVNHVLRNQIEFKEAQKESEYYWHKKYPNESFHIDFTENWEGKEIDQHNSNLSSKRQNANRISSTKYHHHFITTRSSLNTHCNATNSSYILRPKCSSS